MILTAFSHTTYFFYLVSCLILIFMLYGEKHPYGFRDKHRLMIFQDSFCLSCWLWSVSVHHLQGSMILSDISSGESLWLESSSILRPCTLQLQFYRCGQVTHRPTEDLYSRAPSAGPKAKLQQKKHKIFAVFQVFFLYGDFCGFVGVCFHGHHIR